MAILVADLPPALQGLFPQSNTESKSLETGCMEFSLPCANLQVHFNKSVNLAPVPGWSSSKNLFRKRVCSCLDTILINEPVIIALWKSAFVCHMLIQQILSQSNYPRRTALYFKLTFWNWPDISLPALDKTNSSHSSSTVGFAQILLPIGREAPPESERASESTSELTWPQAPGSGGQQHRAHQLHLHHACDPRSPFSLYKVKSIYKKASYLGAREWRRKRAAALSWFLKNWTLKGAPDVP